MPVQNSPKIMTE